MTRDIGETMKSRHSHSFATISIGLMERIVSFQGIDFFLVCKTVQRYDTYAGWDLFRDDECTGVHFGRMKALDD